MNEINLKMTKEIGKKLLSAIYEIADNTAFAMDKNDPIMKEINGLILQLERQLYET